MSVRDEARKNLEMAGLFDKDSDYNGMLGEAVMKLVECHCNEGHSGHSSQRALWLFNQVIQGKALTASFWDSRKHELEKFAMDNMGEPWQEKILLEILGERPKN